MTTVGLIYNKSQSWSTYHIKRHIWLLFIFTILISFINPTLLLIPLAGFVLQFLSGFAFWYHKNTTQYLGEIQTDKGKTQIILYDSPRNQSHSWYNTCSSTKSNFIPPAKHNEYSCWTNYHGDYAKYFDSTSIENLSNREIPDEEFKKLFGIDAKSCQKRREGIVYGQ